MLFGQLNRQRLADAPKLALPELDFLELVVLVEESTREGFRGATVDEIAKAAGMSKPNLLYYFPKKDDIYRNLLEQLLDDWLDPLRDLDPEGEPTRE